MRRLTPLILLFAACTHTAAAPPPKPAGEERRYTMMLGGNRAGGQTTRVDGGIWTIDFEFNDRGRGPKLTTVLKLDDQFLPVDETTTGINYFKRPVNENFTRANGLARWRNDAEAGERANTRAFFPSMYGPPEETAILARALLAAPGRRLPLLPAGEASLEKIGELTVDGSAGRKQVIAYAISGMDFAPAEVWLEADGTFFGSVSSWSTLVREGYESAVKPMLERQDASASKRYAAISQRLQHKPANGVIVIRNARIFDSPTATMTAPQTIVIRGDRIASVGAANEPSGATVIDAAGKTVIPGLWDMHVHLGTGDGLLNLAAGVTSVRDLANDTDFLEGLRKKFDSGSEAGPRVVAAGFMDGPGPYAGPTKVLVSTEDEIRAAIDRYKALGYRQIKIYSSIRPELVPFIAEYARENDMRLSGHIPAFMNAETAVRQGFNEIQHLNMLFLNFMRDVQDTRTPARFIAVAERGADVDLSSTDVKEFIRLLKNREIVSDPTLVVFEGLFIARSGEMSPTIAAVADRLPPQVRRRFLTGGLPVPDGKDYRYLASFVKMLQMTKLLYDSGVQIVAGTDGMAGFMLARELELYVEAGIPAPAVLQIATLGAARVAERDRDLGSIAVGKLADIVIVDGDPTINIRDVRKPVTVIKGGVIYDVGEVERAIGMARR